MLYLSLGLVAYAVFNVSVRPISYIVFPFLVWAALRFGTRGAAAANFIVTSLAIWGTVNGSVVIKGVTLTQTVQLIQALPYVLTVGLLAGFVGRAVAPRAIGVPYVKER